MADTEAEAVQRICEVARYYLTESAVIDISLWPVDEEGEHKIVKGEVKI